MGAHSVYRMTLYVTEKPFGLVLTHATRPCLFYSQRRCEKNETESGWQKREKRDQLCVDIKKSL